MNITVNGTSEEILPCSVQTFIEGKGLSPESVVIEYNYRIIQRNEWGSIRLRENDNLEILRFVGGG